MAPSAADNCVKLGNPWVTDKDYKVWVSNFKRTWLREEHPELIPAAVALAAKGKTLEWEAGIRKIYTEFPTQWALANFVNPVDRRKCPRQFLIVQGKKVRIDLSDEAKATAAQAVPRRAKRRAAPTATPRPPASPASPATLRTDTAPRLPETPGPLETLWLPGAP